MHAIQIKVVVGKVSHELQVVSACLALENVSEVKQIIQNKNINTLYFQKKNPLTKYIKRLV